MPDELTLGDMDTLGPVVELKDPGDILGFKSLFGEIKSLFSFGVLLVLCLAIIIDIATALSRAFSSITLLFVSSGETAAPMGVCGGVSVLVGSSKDLDVPPVITL